MKSLPGVMMAWTLLMVPVEAQSGSFRCGTKLVVTGDPVSRLVRNCGQPAHKIRARESIGSRGRNTSTSVVNWVYERGRKRDMIVSVQGGKVVKIAVE
ncbi:MAG: DUF2845 domain-containing protein [Xanthomonadales bacterium]|nr:DUF2845 domain-containing protein [Xanthomonadales bacterium]NIX13363.1 DUF2845 domain-containing protein [Xanthomonadales bacterium]